ncbi:hypothetical protein, partial [Pseudomonas syringae group genomosp. 3]|uniref:hypothetical protein n=1 Tax=Pseudomonas syringae group genomosp. 3 TaxID=251701 RepID=UPI001C7EDBF3
TFRTKPKVKNYAMALLRSCAVEARALMSDRRGLIAHSGAGVKSVGLFGSQGGDFGYARLAAGLQGDLVAQKCSGPQGHFLKRVMLQPA